MKFHRKLTAEERAALEAAQTDFTEARGAHAALLKKLETWHGLREELLTKHIPELEQRPPEDEKAAADLSARREQVRRLDASTAMAERERDSDTPERIRNAIYLARETVNELLAEFEDHYGETIIDALTPYTQNRAQALQIRGGLPAYSYVCAVKKWSLHNGSSMQTLETALTALDNAEAFVAALLSGEDFKPDYAG